MRFAFALISASAFAADWPTYLHDNERSSATGDVVALPLEKLWEHGRTENGTAAWPAEAKRDEYRSSKALAPRFAFDRANHVAAVGGRVYFGSAQAHRVRCVEAATGTVKWTFYSDGPVRLAPTVAEGRVFFGSDDGSAYCLDAATGVLVWKNCPAGGENRLLPNDGRMVSPWAIRTGVAVADGTAFFGAGLFPHEGVFVCAVDAATGKAGGPRHWEHRYTNEFTPQGAFVLAADRVFVPGGRSTPWALERATGKIEGQFKDKRSGMGTLAMLVGDTLLYGPADRGGSLLAQAGFDFKAVGIIAGAGCAAVTKERLFLGGEKGLAAVERVGGGVAWAAKIPQPACIIATAAVVFTGGAGEVRAFDIADGNELWKIEVPGRVLGLAAADGRLFASNDAGVIFTFGKR